MSSDRIAQLERLLEVDPDDAFCLYGLAMEHAKAGAHDEAVRWFDRVLEVEPTHAYACYHRARTLEEAGRTDEAVASCRDGLERARRGGDAKAVGELEALLDELAG